MSKYIDADKLLKEASKDGAYGYVSAEQIADFPTADVVEVCKCKYCSKSTEHPNGRWCKIHQTVVQNSDYCCWGVRKNG